MGALKPGQPGYTRYNVAGWLAVMVMLIFGCCMLGTCADWIR